MRGRKVLFAVLTCLRLCAQVHGLREAVKAVQAAGKRAVVWTPRVLKPDESRMWKVLSASPSPQRVNSTPFTPPKGLQELYSLHPSESAPRV